MADVRRVVHAVLILAAISSARLASAQIVNVQSVLTTDPEPGFSGSVTTSAAYRTGNIDSLRLSAQASAAYQIAKHRIIGIARGDFGKVAGERYIAKTFEHARYRYFATDLLMLEGFAQHEYDEFRRLTVRQLLGVGPALRLVRGKKTNVTAGLAYMFEYERLRGDEQPDAGDNNTFHRASSYITLGIELDKKIQFVQTLYAQPVLNDPEDVRFLSESQLVFKVNEILATTTAFSYAYDTRTPAAIEKQDTTLSSAIQLTFK